ncbi:tetratricopeptide repeat protein [Embleya sp. MST-111070]|uniref:tetratricopeptide repeat protein n=1 Tax=Embleya sp. MST-111070 TaxID=3398231 RepID=UPI003F738B73
MGDRGEYTRDTPAQGGGPGHGFADGDGHRAPPGGDFGGVALAPVPTRLIPRQIPPSHRDFVNRDAELRALEEVLAGALRGPGPGVVALTGLGGVGKTALAAHWAARAAGRFSDGQLYVDLGQSRFEGTIDVGSVLGAFLRDLGVDEAYIPPTLAGRAATFRSATAGRRLLVFLDNARHAAEVRALLPASGMVIATSRTRIDGLILDGARAVVLDPLSVPAGTLLIRRWLGDGRAADGELAELVRLCGGLPLALRAVGARLIRRRRLSVDRVLTELGDAEHGLDALANHEGVHVERVFDAVYDSFSPAAQRLYRMLAAHPGPTFTPALAAAATGEPDAAAHLDELVDAHLVEEIDPDGTGEERHRFHDLARLHARRHALRDPEPEREAALRRIVAYHLLAADAADRLVLGSRLRLGGDATTASAAPSTAPRFAGRAEALDWLDAERADLLAVLRAAASRGWYDAVWRLCESLWALYHSRKHYADWIESHQLGIVAAQWERRPDAEVRMRNQLARAFHELRDHERAETELRRAEELLPIVSDPRLGGVVWETQGLLHLARSSPEDAVRSFTRAREANTGDAHGIVVQSYNLGGALLAAGRPDEALRVLDEALATAEAAGDEAMRPRIAIVRGRVQHALGATDRAVASLTEAVRAAARLGQHVKEAQALEALVEVAVQAGDAELEQHGRTRLGVLYRELGVPAPEPGADRL